MAGNIPVFTIFSNCDDCLWYYIYLVSTSDRPLDFRNFWYYGHAHNLYNIILRVFFYPTVCPAHLFIRWRASICVLAKFRTGSKRKTAAGGVSVAGWGWRLLLLSLRRRDGGRHWHNLPPSRRRNWLKCKCCDYVSRSYRGLAARRRIAAVVPFTCPAQLR